MVGALKGPYAAVVVSVLGPGTPDGAVDGIVRIDADDGATFAAAWDGARGW
jgi:hypothetical protein